MLLLHGFPQTGACWDGVAERLARSNRLLIPDLPGFGRSGRPGAFDAASVCAALASLLDATDVPEATVVGHDWGGSMAFAFALAYPERVRRLVVTNAPFRKLDLRRGFHFLLFNVPVLPEIAFKMAGDQVVRFMLRAGSARKDVFASDVAVRPYVEAYRSGANVSSALAYYRTVTRRVIAQRLPVPFRTARRGADADRASRAPRGITAPTLIVWGMRDPALPESLLTGIEHDIPQAHVVRLPDVGHFVPDEAPRELAAAIESFIADA